MRKIILSAVCLVVMSSCGNKKEAEKSADDSMSIKEMNTEDVVSIPPEFQKGADLIAAGDCLACHKVDEKVIGPSYKDVAAKYAIADIDMLAKTIINGGVGHWGEIPMTPHPDLKLEDAKEMVKYILSLKNQEAN